MKKFFGLILVLLFVTLLTGCGGKEEKKPEVKFKSGVENITEENIMYENIIYEDVITENVTTWDDVSTYWD